MTSEFGSLGDGIGSSRNTSSVRSSTDKLYPSLFPSDEEVESDNASEISLDSEARATPPLVRLKNPLFPKKEYVDKLRPEEIRWFYKQDGDKEWSPFIGYDSLRIECRFRALQTVEDENEIDNDVILVLGGLYQVDVSKKKCTPVYWSGDESDITQGLWFYEYNGQPLEDKYGLQIETEHVAKFMGHKLDEEQPSLMKGPKPVKHTMRFTDFYIEWNSPSEIYLYSEAASSRFVRGFKKKLGMQKAGTKLLRGFKYEAVMDDKPSDISHLVFVIHGIGQKMETGNIVKRSKELREKVSQMKTKHFSLIETSSQRAEFLPVEWRSNLKLDGDMVDLITPHKMRGMRSILNDSAMDILYYTSPLYRSEITHSLQTELNRLFEMFCTRNPYFQVNGGKVSIVAHSLGAVISYDIITGWNPIQLYDEFVNTVIEEEQQDSDSSEIKKEIHEAKEKATAVESILKDVQEKHRKKCGPTLSFTIENMFCLGSPLAVFLALRGFRPQGKGTLDHIMPPSLCKRLFNIYHPYDPVAYRLEPLILKHYATIMPLPIHRFDSKQKEAYNEMKTKAYAAFKPSASVDKITDKVKWLKGKESDDMSAELKMLEKMEKDVQEIEKHIKERKDVLQEIDHTDLEYRLDYQLREASFSSSYISMLTSHTSYWTDRDVAFFILSHIHPELQEL
ncbi:phospholipase DDHD1-like isoform X2 [Ostrea edulis]|uniref:phospholipase DDHD1-like isoform X2 n=1 Tax=Ostrea edulis TaxID=37623 RepID=UPI0024AF42D5|nr:phospholipase DDHD1-like isoform X2 [Ostrea edulis]